jgi:hypothetical protein
MNLLGRCFLLVFAQLYVGGMLALSVPPFHQVARGFYKSTAGVYLGAGILMLIGRTALLLRHGPSGAALAGRTEALELALWSVSVVAGLTYLRSLWGDQFHLRARTYTLTWSSGMLALASSAQFFRMAPVLSVEALIYPLCFLLSALVLGGVSTGMLLGHWYLIDHDLKIDPFRGLFRFFVWSLAIQAAVLAAAAVMFAVAGSAETAAAMRKLLGDHSGLVALRFCLSPVAAAGISWMIWKTLAIPQTMAATGLFYIAILGVLVGEMLGRFILFRTSLPF